MQAMIEKQNIELKKHLTTDKKKLVLAPKKTKKPAQITPKNPK